MTGQFVVQGLALQAALNHLDKDLAAILATLQPDELTALADAATVLRRETEAAYLNRTLGLPGERGPRPWKLDL